MARVYLLLNTPFSNDTNQVYSAHRDREHAILCKIDLLKLKPQYNGWSLDELRTLAQEYVAGFDVFE